MISRHRFHRKSRTFDVKRFRHEKIRPTRKPTQNWSSGRNDKKQPKVNVDSSLSASFSANATNNHATIFALALPMLSFQNAFQRQVTLKLEHDGELRRIPITYPVSLASLHFQVATSFGLDQVRRPQRVVPNCSFFLSFLCPNCIRSNSAADSTKSCCSRRSTAT